MISHIPRIIITSSDGINCEYMPCPQPEYEQNGGESKNIPEKILEELSSILRAGAKTEMRDFCVKNLKQNLIDSLDHIKQFDSKLVLLIRSDGSGIHGLHSQDSPIAEWTLILEEKYENIYCRHSNECISSLILKDHQIVDLKQLFLA